MVIAGVIRGDLRKLSRQREVNIVIGYAKALEKCVLGDVTASYRIKLRALLGEIRIHAITHEASC